MSRVRRALVALDQAICARLGDGHHYSWTHGAITGHRRPVCLHCQHVQPRGEHGIHLERPATAERRRYRSTSKETR